jgi:hypothetical protein
MSRILRDKILPPFLAKNIRRFFALKRDFEEIIQQRRGAESFDKRSLEGDENTVTLEQIRIITDLLEKAPRSTIINFGATEELVSVVEKATVIMGQMHEMAFGKNQREDKLEEMLLKVFREINAKVKGIDERLARLEEMVATPGRKEAKKPARLPVKKTLEKQDDLLAAEEPVSVMASPEAAESPREAVPTTEGDENDKVVIKGYTFEGIPYTVSDKGVAAFAWKRAGDQEKALKRALQQLNQQGVDTSNTFALKEAGFETIYTKFRNLNLADKDWREWVSSWHSEAKVK